MLSYLRTLRPGIMLLWCYLIWYLCTLLQYFDATPALFSSKYFCPVCDYSLPELEPRLFSFNAPMGACPGCDGLGIAEFFDPSRVVVHPELSLAAGAVRGWDRRNAYYFQLIASLAGRNREADAILVDSTTYWTMIAQGSDTAGFWVSPTGGPTGFTKTESGGLAFWGVPIFYDTNLATEAASKIAIAAEWKAFKLYRGMEFRIDSSDVAGDRWDKNLIGFRGEEEIGFNAETPVHVGAAQLMTAVIP